MNTHRILAAILSIAMCCHALAQDMDTELYNLTEKLAAQIKEHGNKKITVLDFTDLEGRSNELGKYIAEQLTVDFVMAKRDFSVLDRANLKKILAEHKLTATGLIDPENAKKLGMFAGVDALVLGTIIPKGTNISLTAKIITTETAEIVGAAKAVFKVDETVQHLAATAHTEGQTDDTASDLNAERPKISKSFGDLRLDVQSLRVLNGGQQYALALSLSNQSKKSVWVALSTDLNGNFKGNLVDANGYEFNSLSTYITGIASAAEQYGGFYTATEIKPSDSVSAAIKFFSRNNRAASAGQCTLRIEFLSGYDFNQGYGKCAAQSFVAKVKTDE